MNQLAQMKPAGEGLIVDSVTGNATITDGGLTLFLERYASGTYLTPSTVRLLDAASLRFTETGSKDKLVKMPLREYMSLCGLRDVKAARQQVKRDLDALYSMRLSYQGTSNNYGDFAMTRLVDTVGIWNGVININFSDIFFSVMKKSSVMSLPLEYFKLPVGRNRNSQALLRRLLLHRHQNDGKSNQDRIAVHTLLAAAPDIPRRQDLGPKGQTSQRIRKPFTVGMDALADSLTWQYTNTARQTISREQAEAMRFSEWQHLIIHFELKDYPGRPRRKKKTGKH